ncbi:MAG: DUF58 domain-containing protein [Planctomycetaceae bacterium]
MRRRPMYLLRAARFVWFFKLTPTGRMLVLAILLTALGSVTTQLPIYQIFCGLFALLGVSESTALLFRPVLKLTGAAPQRSVAGQTVSADFTLQNTSRWRAAFDLMLGMFNLPDGVQTVDSDAYLPHLRPGERGTLRLKLQTARRGVFALPAVQAVSTFPFNLVRFSGAKSDCSPLLVLPEYHSLGELDIPVSYRYQPGGTLLTQGVGLSPEYIGNREYTPGESVRRIDFKAWARIGKPVVKEFHEEYVSRIALVLDTHLPPSRWLRTVATDRLEAGISLMAAVAERLNFQEHIIDLFAAGPELYVFRTNTGTANFDSVLEILAGIQPCRQNPFDQISPLVAEELESISSCVCIFLEWDETRADFVRHVYESGCRLKGVLVQDGDDSPPPPKFDGDWTVLTVDEIRSGRVDRL